MNKKLQNFIEPGMKMYFAVLCIFALVTLFFNKQLAIAEGAILLFLFVFTLIRNRKKRRELLQYIESVTYDAESARNSTLLNFPLPMVVFKLDDSRVVWGNQVFFKVCADGRPSLDARLSDLVPNFSAKWLMEGKTQCPTLLHFGERKYQVHGNIVRGSKDDQKHDFMGITYWVDVTELDDIKLEYEDSRPVVAIIVLDNYDELTKNQTDRAITELRAAVDDRIVKWAEGRDGLLRRYDRDRYLYIFEERHLDRMIADKFDLLDAMDDVVNPAGIHATVSIGIGRDGSGFAENYSFAALSVEMALSRGGDQAVIKNRFNFEFFGGRGTEVETRTKVKARVMANALTELIRDASQTFIMGHKYGDLDVVGSAVGVCCIARKKGAKAHIVVDRDTCPAGNLIDYLSDLPEYEDVFISPQEAILRADSRSLLVVVDTNRPEQVEDQSLLMACNRVAVIDHHRRAASYIQNATLSFHEQYASSVCELITELLQEIVEQGDILRKEAEAILSGIVMDTKNFTIRTGERTFDAAAFLKRAGADTTAVKLLLQTDLRHTVARYTILQKARLYRSDIAVAVPEGPQDRVVVAKSADEMLNISGVQASLVVAETDSGEIVISARSIGDINVQVLLEQLGGGGNKSVAGAQLRGITLKEAVNRLFAALDAYLEE